MPVHVRYNPAEWSSRHEEPSGENWWFYETSDPARMGELLVRRDELNRRRNLGRAVPADVFVLFAGEPEDRSVTKINGLPYRPAVTPWPREGEGPNERDDWGTILVSREELCRQLEIDPNSNDPKDVDYLNGMFPPLHFLAQFNFGDSRDLVGDLPGDVLLLFGDAELSPFITYYEWQPLGLHDLVRPEQVPMMNLHFPPRQPPPCFGQILRTCDYPDAKGEDWYERKLFCWEATRIGGVPFSAQDIAQDLPGKHLCTLHGIASKDVNVFVNIDAEGQLHWTDECS